jgi:hypothetical protein
MIPQGGRPRDAEAIPLYVLSSQTPLTSSTLVALSSPHIPDSGASHILLRASSLPDIAHLCTPSLVPPITLSQANGAPLIASQGGTLSFPSRAPLLTYILPSRDLAHNLWSVSALIGTNGRATFTPTSVSFFSPSSPLTFLTGTKQATDTLWALSLPLPSVSLVPSPTSLVASPCIHTHYDTDTAAPYLAVLMLSSVLSLFPTVPSITNVSYILTGPLALLSCLLFSLPFVSAG